MIFSIKTYRPPVQLGMLALTLIWVIWKFTTTIPPVNNFPIYEPLSQIYFSFSAQGSALSIFLSIFLLLIQAIYLSYIMQKHNLIERNNWIPAIIYLILSIISINGQLTHVIIANTFIMLTFDRMFSSYESSKGIDNVMLAGFYTTFAFLFYFPSFVLIFAIITNLIIFRHVNWRYFMSIAIGVTIPILYLATWYFLFDQLNIQFNAIRLLLSDLMEHIHKLMIDRITVTILMTILLILSNIFLATHQQGKLIKIRKKTSVLIVFSIFSVIMLFASTYPTTQSLITVSFLVAATFSIQLSESKRQILSASLFWGMVLMTILASLNVI